MKSKTLLILTNNSDGLYGFRHELIEELTKSYNVVAATPNDGYFDELEKLGCRIIETPVDRRGLNPFADIKLFLKYLRIIRKLKPDKVITYTIKPNIYGGLACRINRISYAANITGLGTAFQKKDVLRKLIVRMYKVALKKASVVFFENCGNKETLIGGRIVTEEQCCILNGAGVNTEHYYRADMPTEGTTEFLYIGRIMREKGVNELFRAMQKLKEEGIDCELRMLGDYEENYSELIEQFAREGWLKYDGYQLDVRPFIEKCHCFVLPSWHEGMANTLLECGAMGRPLITSNIHGCMEAVDEGKTGYLHEAKNADSLYEAMKKFALLPYDKKVEMGRASREYICAHFDKKQVVEATVQRLY